MWVGQEDWGSGWGIFLWKVLCVEEAAISKWLNFSSSNVLTSLNRFIFFMIAACLVRNGVALLVLHVSPAPFSQGISVLCAQVSL